MSIIYPAIEEENFPSGIWTIFWLYTCLIYRRRKKGDQLDSFSRLIIHMLLMRIYTLPSSSFFNGLSSGRPERQMKTRRRRSFFASVVFSYYYYYSLFFKKISLDWWAATSSSISLRVLVDSMWRHRGILYTITSVCLITVGMAPLSPTLFVNKRAKKLLLLFLSFPNYDGVCWDDDGSRSRLLSFNNNNNKPRKEKKMGRQRSSDE